MSTDKRRYSEYSKKNSTQREPEYDQDTDLQQWELLKSREKKCLDKRCNPMYFQGVRTIRKSNSTGPQRFGQPWPDPIDSPIQPSRGLTGCWQQHLLAFQAITKSNGWSPDTAALQLFAHLDGEALQVALLLPDRIRECWKDLVDELSAYYNTPGD